MTFAEMLALRSMSAQVISDLTGHSVAYVLQCRAKVAPVRVPRRHKVLQPLGWRRANAYFARYLIGGKCTRSIPAYAHDLRAATLDYSFPLVHVDDSQFGYQ